jgi:hypothetical protein
MKMLVKLFLCVMACALVRSAPAFATDEDAQVNQMLQYLSQTYGLQFAEAAPAAGEIICQSGGTCAVPNGAGGWVNCSCGGGNTCPAGKSCKCTCRNENNQVDCAYDCVDKPKTARAVGVDLE